jgi:glycosyltransferase involved in cell wall biosynthesis
MNARDALLFESLTGARAAGSGPAVLDQLKRIVDALQVIYDDEPGNRRRLYAGRASSEYEAAYSEDEPLVSVIIPTYRSYETLRDRALPSILAQTYTNWEIVVIGDAAPPETGEVIASFADPRIRYENRPMRGPYPEEEYEAWLVSAVPPFNAGMRAALGRWIAPFADDDALRPFALERLVETVKSRRFEFCYSKILLHGRGGTDEEVGAYPPRLSPTGISAGMQGSLLHSELRFFEQELADVIFHTPADWSMVRKMMRAGVRIGFLDEVTADYYPSYRGEDAPGGSPLR